MISHWISLPDVEADVPAGLMLKPGDDPQQRRFARARRPQQRHQREIMSIEIANIKKSFGRTQVLNDISLDIPSGQMVASQTAPAAPPFVRKGYPVRYHSAPGCDQKTS
jgi:ABC-type multidrug transport system fused ATPase/permease subunit